MTSAIRDPGRVHPHRDVPLLKPIWSPDATVADDCTLHQIAPYIGRLKTSIARALIRKQTHPGDLIVDPFCGAGTIALEAAIMGRRVIACDWNPYAVLLSRAKLFPPKSLEAAQRRLYRAWRLSRERLHEQDLRAVPSWVRRFFHPETLRNALAFRDACNELNDNFLLACLLGILHHQRPGFLSYPASHLVPYLRDRNFPQGTHPELYEERDVFSRLDAKVRRTFRRPPGSYSEIRRVIESDARDLRGLHGVQAVITSPPYMNELDYVRDNRLRLWFVDRSLPAKIELVARERDAAFTTLMRAVCVQLAPALRPGGYFVLVVGDATRGNGRRGRTAVLTKTLFDAEPALKRFQLDTVYQDRIPDVRRCRRECRGTKTETVLIYRGG